MRMFWRLSMQPFNRPQSQTRHPQPSVQSQNLTRNIQCPKMQFEILSGLQTRFCGVLPSQALGAPRLAALAQTRRKGADWRDAPAWNDATNHKLCVCFCAKQQYRLGRVSRRNTHSYIKKHTYKRCKMSNFWPFKWVHSLYSTRSACTAVELLVRWQAQFMSPFRWNIVYQEE